jgi:hypothetical protein
MGRSSWRIAGSQALMRGKYWRKLRKLLKIWFRVSRSYQVPSRILLFLPKESLEVHNPNFDSEAKYFCWREPGSLISRGTIFHTFLGSSIQMLRLCNQGSSCSCNKMFIKVLSFMILENIYITREGPMYLV